MQSTFANTADDCDDDDGIRLSTPLPPGTKAVSAPEMGHMSEPDVTTAAPLPCIAVLPTRRNAQQGINLHDDLLAHSEINIARALLRHSVEIVLPWRYKPGDSKPESEMRVVGVKATPISKTKAVLIVKFLSPPSLKDKKIQLFCTSHEPMRSVGKGEDFSIMTAIKMTKPNAKSLYDLGVRAQSQDEVTQALLATFEVKRARSKDTRALLAAFAETRGGSFFDTTNVIMNAEETSELIGFADGYNVRSLHDPVGYTRAARDPKHHGQAMHSPLRAEWLKSQTLEMDGLWRRGVFQRVLRSSLTPQDRVFSSRFHYKIKRKGGEFDKCKVRLVVQGQHMRRKGEDGVGDYADAFSPVPAASGFRAILSLATQENMFMDHVDISQAFVQGELLPGDGHNGNVYISAPPGYDEDPLYVYRLRKLLYVYIILCVVCPI